jgi:hypothetical protein
MRGRLMSLAASTSRTAVAGVSGNAPYFGSMNTGEYLKKLDGSTGRLVYDQMRRSDPQVGAVLKAICLPLRSNDYSIEPASKAEQDVEIAHTIDERLKRGMSITWDDTLRHVLLMLPFGFSILEKVWERVDGQIMPKKLDPRLPQSIVRWESNRYDGSLIGPVQRGSDGREYTLPIEKLLVFTMDKEGDNWEGISILRQAYKPWYIKDQLEKINAIKHDRFGVGMPRAKVPGNVTPDTTEYRNTEDMLSRIYAQEQGYIVQPEGYDIDILGGGGKEGSDALPSIKYYDEAIAKAMLAMFISLGTSETGSRALGQSFFDAFMLSLQTFADYIADVFNRFLIPEWVDYNWNVTGYPTMKAAQIMELDYAQIAALVGGGALTADLDLENAIRRSMNIPERKARPAQPPAPEPDQDQAQKQPATDQPQDAQAQDLPVITASDRRSFADLPLAPEEQLVDLAGITLRLNDAESNLTADILKIRDEQAKNIVIQLVAGRQVHNFGVIARGDMFNALAAVYKQQVKAGRGDVLAETRKQRPDLKLGDLKRPSAQQAADLSLERINLDVNGAAEKLKCTLAQWSIDLRQSGLQGDLLRGALMDRYSQMSTDTWDRMAAGAVNRGWGVGRADGLESIADEIDHCYYSAILDTNVCQVCLSTAHDPGSQNHAPDDAEYATPNPNCLGDGRCRCFTIGVMKAESMQGFGG